jgi:nicotinamidase/pyrazinamidase
MAATIFWDVDTQVDFIEPRGCLYVPGAETIVPNLARLVAHARGAGVPIVGDVDEHTLADEEISERPDFVRTFPPHCLRGTPGQRHVAATRPRDPLWIANRPQRLALLAAAVRRHRGEIYLKKNRLDVFTQPNTSLLLEILQPRAIVVYGVALEFCVACAVEGLLARGGAALTVVRDAVRAVDPARGARWLRRWAARGVRIASTDEVLATVGGRAAQHGALRAATSSATVRAGGSGNGHEPTRAHRR